MKKKLILFLSCLLVILIGAGAIIGIIMTNNSGDNKYRKKLETAKKYVQEEKWEDAVIAYLEVIEQDEMNEDAYYTLAQIYIMQEQMDKAKDILETGIQLTDSQKLKDLYNQYFITVSTNAEKEMVDNELAINTTLLGQIASYNYERYNQKFGSASVNESNNKYYVTHKNLSGVQFVYYNTDTNTTIIDEGEGIPKEDKMPWEVCFEDLSIIISGSEGSIAYAELEKLGTKNLNFGYDNGLKKNVVTFEAAKCLITIECDEEGNISTENWNQVVPKNGNEEVSSEEVFEVAGSIVNAVTGEGVSGAIIYVREQGQTSGNVIAEIEADNGGAYKVEIPEGEYTAEIECKDFISENIDFEVDKWGEVSLEQFVISPKLEEGQIRIVLEWGEYPRDLDSHLEGTTSDGENIHVYYIEKEYDAANLDVDDISSYGPETVTILDIQGEYEYYVHDFTMSGNISTSGATVKVYLPGASSPIVYEVPAGLENVWNVCRISNGTVTDY